MWTKGGGCGTNACMEIWVWHWCMYVGVALMYVWEVGVALVHVWGCGCGANVCRDVGVALMYVGCGCGLVHVWGGGCGTGACIVEVGVALDVCHLACSLLSVFCLPAVVCLLRNVCHHCNHSSYTGCWVWRAVSCWLQHQSSGYSPKICRSSYGTH